MTSTDQNGLTGTFDQDTQEFLLWTLEVFGLQVNSEDDGTFSLEVPRQPDGTFEPRFQSAMQFEGNRYRFEVPTEAADEHKPSVQHVNSQSELFGWIRTQLRSENWPLNASLARQPISVRELADHLFTQYQFDDGQMHLAGCQFEDRPFLRLTYFKSTVSGESIQISHCFASPDGEHLDENIRSELELDEVVRLTGRPPRLADKVLQQWVDVASERCCDGDALKRASLTAATLIWCKYAIGKISFSSGQSSVELPFAGWAKFFLDRRVVPPPYTCPMTGRSSYRLATTDDGQITVAEAIGVCSESGRRVLDSDLIVCSATGRRATEPFIEDCPVSGEKTLRSALQQCGTCRQDVSPVAITNGQCRSCDEIKSVPADDPRMQRIQSRYPRLDQWRSWKISESATAYTLIGSQLWQRMLLVLDKSSLDALRVASRSRLARDWSEATAEQKTTWLGK